MEKCLRKDKTCFAEVVRERNEAKTPNKIAVLQAPRSMKKDREEVLQALEQRSPYSLWRRLCWSRLSSSSPWRIIPEQISTVQDPMLKQGTVWGGRTGREELLCGLTINTIPPSPCAAWGRGRQKSQEVELGGMGFGVKVRLFFWILFGFGIFVCLILCVCVCFLVLLLFLTIFVYF